MRLYGKKKKELQLLLPRYQRPKSFLDSFVENQRVITENLASLCQLITQKKTAFLKYIKKEKVLSIHCGRHAEDGISHTLAGGRNQTAAQLSLQIRNVVKLQKRKAPEAKS